LVKSSHPLRLRSASSSVANTYRFYMATTIGTGTRADPFRAALTDFIVADGTQDFWSWFNPTHSVQFCLAWCDPTLHTTIAADSRVTVLSPQWDDVNTHLDDLVGTIPSGTQTALETNGIPVAWIDASTTYRDVWRWLSKRHIFSQSLIGTGDTNVVNFIKNNLDTTVGSLSAAVRNAGQNWMTNHGLDTSWITGTTTVRQVVKFIIANGSFSIMKHGPANL